MKVRITEFSQRDSARHFHSAGEVGEVNIENWSDGWSYCRSFTFENGDVWPLFEFKYEPVYSIEYPGGTMNQDGTVTKRVKITGLNNFAASYKKAIDKVCEHQADAIRHAVMGIDLSTPVMRGRKSWLQKIRDYDKLQSRCNSAEAMRDHYKTSLESWESLAISKARELELMSKVADNWQQRLICVQKDLMDATEMIGKRLKFSVGHNRVEIIVGNPVTVCELYNQYLFGEEHNVMFAYSICSKKDTYNWKTGVIKSLDNFCDWNEFSQYSRRQFKKALAKKYPEVFRD